MTCRGIAGVASLLLALSSPALAGSAEDRGGHHGAEWARPDAVVNATVEARSRIERFQAVVSVEIDTGEDRIVTYGGRMYFVRGVEEPDVEAGEVGHRMMWRLRDQFQDVERLWHSTDRIVGVDELDRFIFLNQEIGGVANWEPVSLVFFGLDPSMRDDWILEVAAVGGRGTFEEGVNAGVVRDGTVPTGENDQPEGTEETAPTPEQIRGQGTGERGPVSPYTVLVMIPRSDACRRRFRRVEMHVDHQTGIPIHVSLTLANGRIRRITLTELSTNSPFTDLNGNPAPMDEVLLTPDTAGYDE